jgi:hypothetical protein
LRRDEVRREYFEGRLHLLKEELDAARAAFKRVVSLDPQRPEPRLRLAECLRTGAEPEHAEASLRPVLAGELARFDSLWKAWFEIAALDLRWDPVTLLGALPPARGESPAALDDFEGTLRWALARLADEQALRVNCGGAAFRSRDGSLWSRDRGYLTGLAAYLPEIADLERYPVSEPALYQTERWFGDAGTVIQAYRFVLPSGRYEVTLHFIEGGYKEPERRAFGIILEGRTVEELLEPREPGFGVPIVRTYPVEVHDGALDLGFVRRDANPQVAGIEIREKTP